jgi:hypothetical protein
MDAVTVAHADRQIPLAISAVSALRTIVFMVFGLAV